MHSLERYSQSRGAQPAVGSIDRNDATRRGAWMPLLVASVVLLNDSATLANPLNPLDYPSLGTRTLAAGSYTVNTGATPPTIIGPGTNITGTVQSNGASGIAVFSFESLTIPSTATITVVGNRPLALLAVGNLTIGTSISVNGGPGGNATSVSPGGGGLPFAGGSSGDTGGGVPAFAGSTSRGGSGSGIGGGGGGSYIGQSSSYVQGAGGGSYGDLLLRLDGGSGGGGGGGSNFASDANGGGGGAGGGAIELGALLFVNITGQISANGGAGGTGFNGGFGSGGSGGGGSGGGILIHGSMVNVFGASAQGASGGISTNGAGGGGGGFGGSGSAGRSVAGGDGGGGRVTIQYGSSWSSNNIAVGSAGFGAAGVSARARVTVSATDLDFGSVPIGSSRTLFMGVQNTGDANTSLNGYFPDALGAPFSRVDNGVFSSIKPGRSGAARYAFAPTALGPFNQTLNLLSNAGQVQVNIRGTGVSSCRGDFDNSGSITVQDVFDFLAAYFAGCP